MPIRKSRSAKQTEHNTATIDPARSFTVVGIGASAGGFQAFEAIFRHWRTLRNALDVVVVSSEDISRYKNPVDSLTVRKSPWRGPIETAPMDNFIVTDRRPAFLNPGTQDFIDAGFQEERPGKSVRVWMHRDSHRGFRQQTDRFMAEGRPEAVRKLCRCPAIFT